MITHVAIKLEGKTFCLPEPYRHSDVIKTMISICGIKNLSDGVHGFMNDDGRFLSRFEAFEEAFECGQLKNDDGVSSILNSEMLW